MPSENRTDIYPAPLVDRSGRPSAITRLIILMIVLTGVAVFFSVFRHQLGDPFLLGLLGVLAMIGVAFLFAAAIGFVHFLPRTASDDLSKAFLDTMEHGIVVTDQKGRIVYVNGAYAEMTGAADAAVPDAQ